MFVAWGHYFGGYLSPSGQTFFTTMAITNIAAASDVLCTCCMWHLLARNWTANWMICLTLYFILKICYKSLHCPSTEKNNKILKFTSFCTASFCQKAAINDDYEQASMWVCSHSYQCLFIQRSSSMMWHNMMLQVAFVAKLMATDWASEVFLPVMSVGEVPAEVALLAQSLVADRTVKLEETTVDCCLMQSQVVLRTQQFAADVARELSTSGCKWCVWLTLWGWRWWETMK